MSPGKPLFFATDEDRDGTDPFTDTYDQSLHPIEYFEDTLSLIGTLIPTARNRTTAVSGSHAPVWTRFGLCSGLACVRFSLVASSSSVTVLYLEVHMTLHESGS